jgi:Protein of unknown function (DUF2764)
MKNYYFLAISLPTLEIGLPPEKDRYELERLLKDNLSPSDFNKVIRLRSFYDILNIYAFWTGEKFDYWGNMDENQLEEELLTQELGLFPTYVVTYLSEYESREDRLKHFPQLLKQYFTETIAHTTGFLKWYAEFERNIRLVLTGFRARQLHRNLSAELQYEDPEEPIIAQLLAQKEAKSFEPPAGFEDLKAILERNYKAPMELQKALMEYRFNAIEERLTFDPFSIDRILSYLVQYMMVDKWMQYDKEEGIAILDTMEREKT